MGMKACLNCGDLSAGSRCPLHTSQHATQSTAKYRERIGYTNTAMGYGSQWQRLSRLARKLQPFCSDCFTDEDLTTDHSAEAHERQARGLAVRLADVDVCCRSCNSKRGRSRPDTGQGDEGTGKGSLRPGVRHPSTFEPAQRAAERL
jgi:5-methylcytosine-specific restriction endonuclease McrA